MDDPLDAIIIHPEPLIERECERGTQRVYIVGAEARYSINDKPISEASAQDIQDALERLERSGKLNDEHIHLSSLILNALSRS